MKDFKQKLNNYKDNPAVKLYTATTQAPKENKKVARKKIVKEEIQEQAENHKKSLLPNGYKINYDVIEKRTKRYLLSLQPSLFNKIQKVAKSNKLSINDFIINILQERKELRK